MTTSHFPWMPDGKSRGNVPARRVQLIELKLAEVGAMRTGVAAMSLNQEMHGEQSSP
jgi:hypothetical protein